MTNQTFAGAWLTDVDDTLLPSGETPDDAWIKRLTSFLEIMRAHNLLWIPVSGVAIAKMGPRLLYRLPEHLLTHVFYYGGEGSTRNYYDFEQKKWLNDTSFKRHFSDAQGIAMIGKARFQHYLEVHHLDETVINQRINSAQNLLKQQSFNKPCLIDEMEQQLEQQGFDKGKAETFYRGGAISWMMLGDQSVKHYRGNRETLVRNQIRDFADDWLEANHYLRDLGDPGVHMPYKHATRGIKMVLEGNDKGRAAENLMHSFGLPAESILFVGNELFAGGNDNSVRRVSGVPILSVGEKEDPGVIDGGVQTKVNQLWMDWITQELNVGTDWQYCLEAMQDKAPSMKIAGKIMDEQERSSDLSDWHLRFSQAIAPTLLADIIIEHLPMLENTRHANISLRKVEYDLLARLAVLDEFHYDEARKMVRTLIEKIKSKEGVSGAEGMAESLKHMLFPELKQIVITTYIDQLNLPGRAIAKHIAGATTVKELQEALNELFLDTPLLDYSEEKQRADVLLNNWCSRIETLAGNWFKYLADWKQKKTKEQTSLSNEPRLQTLRDQFSDDDIYYYFKRIVPRIYNFPHLKDLDKPTIVLVAGTSGVGKSTISQHISKTLGISTYFSTDVTSRSVMRATYQHLLGDEAKQLYPELYGSSFEDGTLEWFYTQAVLSMVGTSGSLERLVQENVSAVIEGVSLIPGTLNERFFEIANIVWIVVSINDEETHFQRLGKRSEAGVDRGGAERYQQKIQTIRSIHNRLDTMGKRANVYTIDNGNSLHEILVEVLKHIKNPYSNRGLPVQDSYRDSSQKNLNQRKL